MKRKVRRDTQRLVARVRRIEDGWWFAEMPAVQGAYTQGRTRAEALENLRSLVVLIDEVRRERRRRGGRR